MGQSSAKSVNMSGQVQMIRETIKGHKVVMFSKTTCPFCKMAKETFARINVKPYVIELDGRSDSGEIQDILNEMTGGRTVPRIFIDGKFVGGGQDVKRMYEEGTLQRFFS